MKKLLSVHELRCRLCRYAVQVRAVSLRELPGFSGLDVLSECAHLTTLTITTCRLAALEGLQACKHLQYLDVQVSADIIVISVQLADGMRARVCVCCTCVQVCNASV